MDKDQDGKITYEEFANQPMIRQYPPDKIRDSFKALDRRKSGFIDEFEWTLNFTEKYWGRFNNRKKLSIKEIILQDRLDVDEKYCYRVGRTMFIHMQRNEKHKSIKWQDFFIFYKQWVENINDDDITKIFVRADVDRNGTIELNEFIRVFMNEH